MDRLDPRSTAEPIVESPRRPPDIHAVDVREMDYRRLPNF